MTSTASRSVSEAAPAAASSSFLASKAAVSLSRTALTRWPKAGFCSRGTSRRSSIRPFTYPLGAQELDAELLQRIAGSR